MASRFGQTKFGSLQDPTGLFEHRDPSPTSPQYDSTIWWEDREGQPDNEESLREQLKTVDDHVSRLQEMLKYERTKCNRLQLRSRQQEAELKRREQNINKLKEKLSLFTDRHKDKTPAIRILNTLPSARGKREQLIGKRQEDGAVLLMLERREAELREAMKLRHSLTSVLHALRCDMEQTLSEIEGCLDETHYLDKRLDQAERALGDHVTGGVVQSWRQVQSKLGTCIYKEGSTAFNTDQDKLMAHLEGELKESQRLVQMQQKILQDSVWSPVPSELGNCYFIEEWDRLREHWTEFEVQRRTFESERKAFTEAAIRLSHERQDFEQRKASLVKHQFLCDSPVYGKGIQPSNKRESAGLGLSGIKPLNTPGRHMSVTPTAIRQRGDVTGYPRTVRIQTPSTPELYSALKLPYSRCGSTEDLWNSGTNPAADPQADWSF
ncbi:unnamed protein product [Knipowitschia caucasica]|uniref:Uncharacterized protein n=1 Tax=Knipowitschia caucasica TaxID=637954 RepID=A0AAV2LIL5_KNICA